MTSRERFRILVVLSLAAGAAALVVGAAAGRSQSRAAKSSLVAYLVRGEKVSPVRRLVPQTRGLARASLAALLRGPTSAERRLGYRTMIPSRTGLRDLSLADGLLTVDLSSRFQAGGGSLSMQLRVAQVVFTATQLASVQRVAFRLDGRPVKAIGGEGVMVDPPVGRTAFEAQAPAILVEQPLPGDTPTTPLEVRGSANVFEAQLAVDVKTTTGKLLTHRNLRASAGTGTRGRFSVRLPLRGTTGKVVVVAYSRSAKNGARINIVRVPITLRP
jgi:Sporulation and spore germination/Immunoglobulin-like domain of bacterial spore germination